MARSPALGDLDETGLHRDVRIFLLDWRLAADAAANRRRDEKDQHGGTRKRVCLHRDYPWRLCSCPDV
jgi:hypothetical protein